MNNFVNKEDFVHYKNGSFRGKINWQESIGKRIRFRYDGIDDFLIIKSFIKDKKRIIVNYRDFDTEIACTSMLNAHLGFVVGKYIKGFRYSVGQHISNINCDVTIIDTKRNKHHARMYKYLCHTCGNVDWSTENTISSNICICSACANMKVIIGFNDIPTTAPWMVEYFQGGYDEAKNFTRFSNKKITPKCPNCGRIKNKKMSIYEIFKTKSIGCNCGDHISYPNKFMYMLLELINESFISEYSPKWAKPYRYDFFVPNKKLIIEMDGGIGHGNKTFSGDKRTMQQCVHIDNLKNNLAKRNGLEIVRIDCKKSDMKIIKSECVAKLSKYFNIDGIKWDECDKYATGNLVKTVCEYYQTHTDMSTNKLATEFGLHENTIRRYLKRGTEFGWCNYNAKSARIEANKKTQQYWSKHVYVYNLDGECVGEYKSYADAARKSVNDFGFRISVSGIRNAIKNNTKYHNKLVFSNEGIYT